MVIEGNLSDEVKRERIFSEKIREHFESLGMTDKNAPGYYILTLGCQQNEADSEKIAGLAEEMGYRKMDFPDDAMLILVNTCAVREHAEQRALSFIGQFKHVYDKNPDTIIGVGGCMVTQKHRAEKLKYSYPYVAFSFDTGSIHKIPELVLDAMEEKKRHFEPEEPSGIYEGIPVIPEKAHSAWLSVMYGCNNFCSYCIVPYVRGRERSREPSVILSEAKALIEGGAKEITLLGQNVNSYGKTLEEKKSISSLIHDICALEGDFRIRFMTSHPKDVSDELIETFAEEDKVVKHFHLPVQSGSDRILKKMNRNYTAEHYMEKIEKIKSLCPDVTLTSDVMVGFPGENEEDFNNTLELLEKVRYDMIFSFIFSPREGTPAWGMELPDENEVAERFRRMVAFQDKIAEERNQRFVGRTEKLLVTEVSKKDSSFLTGRGMMARPVHFIGSEEMVGNFADVEIISAGAYTMEGKTAEKEIKSE